MKFIIKYKDSLSTIDLFLKKILYAEMCLKMFLFLLFCQVVT